MSAENTLFFGSAALNCVSTWYCHVFRIALKGMNFFLCLCEIVSLIASEIDCFCDSTVFALVCEEAATLALAVVRSLEAILRNDILDQGKRQVANKMLGHLYAN